MKNSKKLLLLAGAMSATVCNMYAIKMCAEKNHRAQRESYWVECAQRCDLPKEELDAFTKKLSCNRPISDLHNVSGSPYTIALQKHRETNSVRCIEMAAGLLILEITVLEKRLEENRQAAKDSEENILKRLEELKAVRERFENAHK
jgi:hypothetical protein